jgi:hypothetical protein
MAVIKLLPGARPKNMVLEEDSALKACLNTGMLGNALAHLRNIGGNDPHEGTAQRGPPSGARASPDVAG